MPAGTGYMQINEALALVLLILLLRPYAAKLSFGNSGTWCEASQKVIDVVEVIGIDGEGGGRGIVTPSRSDHVHPGTVAIPCPP